MDMKELATLLDGCEYGEIPVSLVEREREAGLVILYGESDDLAELRGAVEGEIGCYKGGELLIGKKGFVVPRSDKCEACEHYIQSLNRYKRVKAVWCDSGDSWRDCCWMYEIDTPHETFDILDDGELYCCGIVFEAAALEV